MLAHLEQLSGKKIRSRADLSAYVAEISQNAAQKQSARLKLKSVALWGLLLVAILQYYFIDVQLQIMAQPNLTVFYPIKDAKPAGTRI